MFCLVLPSASSAAAPSEQLAVVVTASPVLSADRASLTRTSLLELVPPALDALKELRQQQALTQRRKQAGELLQQAAKLVRQVAYDDALTQLDAAERLSIDGMARLVEPQLLAAIYFERAIALLPSDMPIAKRELRKSFALWPEGAKQRMTDFAPRIEALIRQAQQSAKQRDKGLAAPEAGGVCSRLGIQRLLVAHLEPVQQGKQELLTIRLFDAGLDAWRWTVKAQWIAGSHTTTLPPRIVAAMRARFSEPASKPPVKSRRRWPWIVVGGLATASGVTATIFGLLASDRASQAESLAGTSIPYEPRVADLEAKGKLFERGAIIGWIAAAALATTAAVGLLWPRGEPNARQKASLLLAPGAVGVTVSLD